MWFKSLATKGNGKFPLTAFNRDDLGDGRDVDGYITVKGRSLFSSLMTERTFILTNGNKITISWTVGSYLSGHVWDNVLISFYDSDDTRLYFYPLGNCHPTNFASLCIGKTEDGTYSVGLCCDTKWIKDHAPFEFGQYYFNSVVSQQFMNEFFEGSATDDTDPYPDDDDDDKGGEGDLDDTGEDIDIPPLPTVSAADSGFITVFNPTSQQLKNLANYMWTGPFDLATYKKIFADPMDCILGLSIVPINVPSAIQKNVTVGNIDTGISLNLASAQYVEVDCGTITIKEYWGSYLDYDPYTKVDIFLPYVGMHSLKADDVMKKPIHVVYHIDVITGGLMVYVKCGGSVLYSFSGQCSMTVPITGNNWNNAIASALSIAAAAGSVAIAGAAAAGGASAAATEASLAGTALAAGESAINNVMSMKPSVERSGNTSGCSGILGIQKPYVVITRPRLCKPDNQNAFTGYPAYSTLTLSGCNGYTEVQSVHLENISATDAEKIEIENLLKGGVLI